MKTWNPYNSRQLDKQIRHQKSHSWTVDTALNWSRGIQSDRAFLPLDKDCLVFPGANPEQQLALSQFSGLFLNQTISETESVIYKLKDCAWNQVLKSYPINPEMRELGELFFEEEQRHSEIFSKYNQQFCEQEGIDPRQLRRILPSVYGSHFQKAIIRNSQKGGHALWWVIASVEEVSIEAFKQMMPYESDLDPLYFEVHQLHFEDEARHRNYAFFMLDVIHDRPSSPSRWYFKKTDLLRAQVLTSAWVLSELQKVFRVEELKDEHPFFATLASSMSLVRNLELKTAIQRLFGRTPYISHVLNTRYHRHTTKMAEQHHAWSLPFPTPHAYPLHLPEKGERS